MHPSHPADSRKFVAGNPNHPTYVPTDLYRQGSVDSDRPLPVRLPRPKVHNGNSKRRDFHLCLSGFLQCGRIYWRRTSSNRGQVMNQRIIRLPTDVLDNRRRGCKGSLCAVG